MKKFDQINEEIVDNYRYTVEVNFSRYKKITKETLDYAYPMYMNNIDIDGPIDQAVRNNIPLKDIRYVAVYFNNPKEDFSDEYKQYKNRDYKFRVIYKDGYQIEFEVRAFDKYYLTNGKYIAVYSKSGLYKNYILKNNMLELEVFKFSNKIQDYKSIIKMSNKNKIERIKNYHSIN